MVWQINIKGDGTSLPATRITGVTLCFSEQWRYIQLCRLHRIALLFWLRAAHGERKKKWKRCFVIAAEAEETSLQSLRALVNASKPAGATLIFLFLIGSLPPPSPLLFFESNVRCSLWSGGGDPNWWCHTMKQVAIIFSAGTFYPFSVTILLTCTREPEGSGG